MRNSPIRASGPGKKMATDFLSREQDKLRASPQRMVGAFGPVPAGVGVLLEAFVDFCNLRGLGRVRGSGSCTPAALPQARVVHLVANLVQRAGAVKGEDRIRVDGKLLTRILEFVDKLPSAPELLQFFPGVVNPKCCRGGPGTSGNPERKSSVTSYCNFTLNELPPDSRGVSAGQRWPAPAGDDQLLPLRRSGGPNRRPTIHRGGRPRAGK
jgi:hypothetical protein